MTILAPAPQQPPADDLRGRLDRLTSATADLTPGAHRLLTHSLNMLDDIADQTPGLDITDWSQVWLHAMTFCENMQTARLAGQPYEEWGSQLKDCLAALAGIIYRALGADEPQVGEPSGCCDSCTCCTASGCGNGVCPTDRIGDSVCPCTSLDHTPEQPAGIVSGFDVLDIGEALRNAAATDCTALTARDRQSLALLTYADVSPLMRKLLARLANRVQPIPLPRPVALHLLVLADSLPPVSDHERDAWLAARDADTPCVVDRIIGALASYAATRTGEDGAHLLHGALQTAIRAGKPGIPLDEVPDAADAELVAARGDLDGLLPALASSPIDRAAHIIAARAARDTSTTALLGWALRTLRAEVLHGGPSPISDAEQYEAHEWADDLIGQVRAEQQAADYDDTPEQVTR